MCRGFDSHSREIGIAQLVRVIVWIRRFESSAEFDRFDSGCRQQTQNLPIRVAFAH